MLSFFLIEQIANAFSRGGHKSIASKLHDKTRILLQDCFDVIDFDVAAIYTFLGLYLISCGEVRRASFFLRNSKDFLDKCDSPYSRYLGFLVTGNLVQLTDMKNLALPLKNSTDVFANSNSLPSLSATLHPNFIDERTKFMLDVLDTNFKRQMPTAEFEIKRITLLMYSLGAKLQYVRAGATDVTLPTLEIANAITELSASWHFANFTVWTTTAVVEAAKFQMEHLIHGADKSIVERLRQDSVALHVMANRHVMTTQLHGTFMNELDQFIETYETIEGLGFAMRFALDDKM
jgi:hypothetical protein